MVDSNVVLYALYAFFGGATFIANVNIVLLIALHRKLNKSKETILIGLICAADLLGGFSIVIAGSRRTWLAVRDLTKAPATSYDCARTVYTWTFCGAYQMIGLSILVVACDRFFSVMFPGYYRKLNASYAYSVVAGVFVYVSAGVAVCGYVWLTSPPVMGTMLCFAQTAYPPQMWDYVVVFRQVTILTALFVYVPVGIRIHRLYQEMLSHTAPSRESIRNKKHIKSTILMGMTLFLELVLVLIPDFCVYSNIFGLQSYQMVAYLMVCFKGFLNIFLYPLKHDEIRGAVISLIGKVVKIQTTRKLTGRQQQVDGQSTGTSVSLVGARARPIHY